MPKIKIFFSAWLLFLSSATLASDSQSSNGNPANESSYMRDFFLNSNLFYCPIEESNISKPCLNITAPSGAASSLSPIIVFIGIVINCIMYYKTASQRKNEKRAGLRDDFWLRSVLIPEIKREVSEISKNHIKWWKSYIKSLDSGANHASLNLADYLDKNFQEDTHFILMAIEKMETADTALFNTFTTAVQNFFEGLEEEIIEKCAEIETATSTEDKRSLAENIIKEFKFLTLNTLVELIVPHIKYSDTINKI